MYGSRQQSFNKKAFMQVTSVLSKCEQNSIWIQKYDS